MEEFGNKIGDDELSADPVPNFTSINKRYLNFLIDLFIILFSFIFAVYLLVIVFKFIPQITNLLISIAVYYFVYYFLFESLTAKTPGKYFTATKVVDLKNKRAALFRIFIRTTARFVPIDILSYLFSGFPAGFHDLVSRTVTTDQNYNKIRTANYVKSFVLIIFETIAFVLISVSVFFAFRFAVFNLTADFRILNKIPALINQEITSLVQTQPEKIQFADEQFGISFLYPDNWVKVGSFGDPNQPAVLFIRSKKALIKISKPVNDYTGSADEYVEISEKGKVIKKDIYKIGGQSFYRYITDEISDGKQMRMMSVVRITKGRAYVFSYAGYEDEYDKYLGEAQEIFNTIKIK